MLNVKTAYPTKFGTATTEFPWGAPQDVTSPGDGTGSPWRAAILKDLYSPWWYLLDRAGITVNNISETALLSQGYNALSAVFRLRNYHADNDNYINDRNIGSDGDVYKCLIDNGPNITGPVNPTVDPVGDVTGTWLNESRPETYYALIDYVVFNRSIGSDGDVYECRINNGPSSSVVDPVGDVTGTWKNIEKVMVSTPSYVQTGAVATGSTVIPNDNTIPQNTEGDQYLTVSHTPKNALNILEITTIINFSTFASGVYVTAALFQDSVVNSLAALQKYVSATAAQTPDFITFRHTMVAGTTSQIDFKLRAGGNTSTLTVNGVNGVGSMNGVMATSMTVKEFTP